MSLMLVANSDVADFLQSMTQVPLLLAGLIVLATFILEDAATLAAALLASQGIIDPALGLGALYFGIVAGDLGLYGLGRYAASHPRAVRWVGERRIQRGRDWMDDRLAAALIGARFLPGMRLPTYIASGFLKVPLFRFAMIVVVAAAAWTSVFYYLVYRYGSYVVDFFGNWSWLIGAFLLINIIVLPRHLGKRIEARGGDGGGSKTDELPGE